jgi:hypothetical protein
VFSDGLLTLRNGKSIYHHICNDEMVNAEIFKSSETQYVLRVNNGLLKSCYSYIDKNVRAYYQVAKHKNNLSEEAFVRFVGSAMSDMIFWHEYSQVARGHFDYLDEQKSKGVCDLQCKRNVELDADIYGASFLFARHYAVYANKRSGLSLDSVMQIYAIGIRSAFEILHENHNLANHDCSESEHPHSLLRAYSAITCAVSGPIMKNIEAETVNRCCQIALNSLLSFESSNYCSLIDVDMLKKYVANEWSSYFDQKDRIDKFSMLVVSRLTIWRKMQESLCRLIYGALRWQS